MYNVASAASRLYYSSIILLIEPFIAHAQKIICRVQKKLNQQYYFELTL